MKFTLTAWAAAVAAQIIIDNAGGYLSPANTLILYIVIEAMLRETAFGNRIKWCKNPQVRVWAATEFTITTQSFALGATMIGIMVLFLFSPTGIDMALLGAAILSVNLYARVFIPKTMGEPDIEKFKPLRDSQIEGNQYRLPPWWFLKHKVRKQLWEESHRKVPALGETHLFVYRGCFKTVVRILAPGRTYAGEENIPEEILKMLETYPKTPAKWIIEDPVPLIRQF